MALFKCIECGHTVSDKAAFCPGCGCPTPLSVNKNTSAPIGEHLPMRKKRKTKKHKKLPNGFGSIKRLSGNRAKPYAAYPPVTGFKLNGSPMTVPAIGYFDDWYKAYNALAAYNKNPYDLSADDLTFADVFRMYFEAKYVNNKKREYSESSKTSTNAAFKNCQAIHDKNFKKLRKSDLQAVVDSCQLKHSSLELIVSLFKQMYRYAAENDMIEKDYSQFVTINIPDDDENGEPFSQEELDILWKNKDLEDVRIILIMIYSGFRIKAFESIETNLEQRYFCGGVKTAAGKNRIVPIHPAIYSYVSSFDVSKFKAATFRLKHFYPTLDKLGILFSNGKKHTPHDCRHTFSWLCDTYGVDDFTKHLLMGHSMGNDVEKSVYGHRTLAQLRAAIEKIKI